MKKNFLIAAAIASISIIIASCGKSAYTAPGGSGGTTGFATDSITMSGMRYGPAIDTVHVGVPVKWQNLDGYSHTVTSDDGTTLASSPITAGTNFSFTPTTPGTFTYHCIYHVSMGMRGTLIVKP